MKPFDYPLGSLESRAAAREIVERKAQVVFRIVVEHIAHPSDEALPPPIKVPWGDGVAEIVYVAGGAR